MMLLLLIIQFIFLVKGFNDFSNSVPKLENYHNFSLSKEYTENTETETGSISPVTGIYLDYRLYDSLFESLLLIISVIGIRFINKRDIQ
jgi:multicomponent Na+:H+ antiporter subunit B